MLSSPTLSFPLVQVILITSFSKFLNFSSVSIEIGNDILSIFPKSIILKLAKNWIKLFEYSYWSNPNNKENILVEFLIFSCSGSSSSPLSLLGLDCSSSSYDVSYSCKSKLKSILKCPNIESNKRRFNRESNKKVSFGETIYIY